MIRLDRPSFTIEGGEAVITEGGIARHQIQNALRAIFVCEDWLDQQQRKRHIFQIDAGRDIRFQRERVHSHELTLLLVGMAQGHFAIGLERHDKVFVQVQFNEAHVLSGGVPDVVEHMAKRNLIIHRWLEHLTVVLVLAYGRTAFRFARLFVGVGLGLGNEREADGEGNFLAVIQTSHEVESLDHLPAAVVVMPADDVILVRIRFRGNAIVQNQHAVRTLHLPHVRFDHPPQVGGGARFAAQTARHLVVADTARQQLGQADGRHLAERTNQVIAVEVEQLWFFHVAILHLFTTDRVR